MPTEKTLPDWRRCRRKRRSDRPSAPYALIMPTARGGRSTKSPETVLDIGFGKSNRRFGALAAAIATAAPRRRRRARHPPHALPILRNNGKSVRGGGRGYQNGGPLFANLSPRLSLFSDP